MKTYIYGYEIRLSNMKRFSADQQEMEVYKPREHGEKHKGPMTLIRTTVNKDHAIAPKVSRRLVQGWEEYVYAERIRCEMYGKLELFY